MPGYEVRSFALAGALKLVADAFPWAPGSCFAYTRDNHNSVLGIREEALAAGACALAMDPKGSAAGRSCWGYPLKVPPAAAQSQHKGVKLHTHLLEGPHIVFLPVMLDQHCSRLVRGTLHNKAQEQEMLCLTCNNPFVMWMIRWFICDESLLVVQKAGSWHQHHLCCHGQMWVCPWGHPRTPSGFVPLAAGA